MKLPVYQSQVSPQVNANLPRLSIPGEGALGESIARFGAGLADAAGKLAYVEDQLEQSRQAVHLAQTTTDLEAFTADRVEKTDSSVGAAVAAERYQKEADAFIAERMQGITDERQRNLATAHLTARANAGAREVRHRANTRIIEDTQANALEQIRLLTASGKEEDLTTAQGLIEGLTAAGIFTAEAGNALSTKATKDATVNRFALDVQADPTKTIEDVGLGRGIYATLDDAERLRLKGVARERIEREISRQQAEEDRATRLNEKAFKAQYEIAISDLASAARNKQLSLGDLETARTTLRMKEEDYTKLWNVISETKEPASNPDLLRRAEIAVRSEQPGITKAQLASWYGSGGLNTADYDRLDNKLTENLRHLDVLNERGETRVSADHAQAEQLLRTALQTTSPLEVLNQEGQQAYSLALDELTRRSKRFGGKEDPIPVYRDILPKYQAVLEQAVSGRVSVMRSTLKHRSVTDLRNAYQGKAQDQGFFDSLRTLRDIENLENAMARMPQKPKGEDFGREPKK